MHKAIRFTTQIEYGNIRACVYKIWFGCSYYIGATKNFYARVSDHRRALNIALNDISADGTYAKIVPYLISNDHIEEAIIEVVRVCLPEEIYKLEEEYHLAALSDKRCLNVFHRYRFKLKVIEYGRKIAAEGN